MGVLRPRFQLLPMLWRDVLGPEGCELAASRRNFAMKTGSWWRGRAVALLFTAVGLLVAALLVGSTDLGTAWGTIQFSLWFSLWSFLGLLTLPTLSRRGVIEIDERVQSEGYSALLMRANTERLDRLQDGEPMRNGRSSGVSTRVVPDASSSACVPRNTGPTHFDQCAYQPW